MDFTTESGATPLSVSANSVAINSSLKGSAQTRGKVLFSSDGKQTQYAVKFAIPCAVEPIVTISTNQFSRNRLVSVDTKQFVVEFEQAPKAGAENVVVWWLAQE